MKRHSKLLELSREHHGALKLALECKRSVERGNEEEMVALAQRIVLLFETELEPHFQEEELDLLPLLAASGERELVTRTLDDHEALRKWITRLATARGGDGEALSAFGIALAAHVRFEERELFEQAQGCLDLDDGRG